MHEEIIIDIGTIVSVCTF